MKLTSCRFRPSATVSVMQHRPCHSRQHSAVPATGLILGVLLAAAFSLAAAPAVQLARDGTAHHSVTTAAQASPRVQAAAKTLAEMLGKISGAKFQTTTGDGQRGLAVGRAGDFPGVNLPLKSDPKDPTLREDYVLRSHANGIWLVGNTDFAVEHAVWDFLHRLGYRQFFPGPHWEIIPTQRELSLAVDVTEHPSYYARRIWYGFGPWDYAAAPYADWCAKNRATSGIALNSGHAYDGILNRNHVEFHAHAEYLGLQNGERRTSKFCISNPGLRRLVVADALAQFAKNPDADSVSLDPSDGGGWCECAPCQAMGSVPDRALTLANEAAAAVTAKYGDKFIGMYAYSQHSPPPNIAAHPRVVISIATAFITGGFSVDQLIDGWQQRAKVLGIREYYSVNTWDRDLPGAARGGRIQYLKTSIPHFHERGARFLSAESSDNWGPNGLGYYLAARLLWDVREAGDADALVADFLDRSFGPVRQPMAEFYKLLTAEKRPPLSDDLVGRLYRRLDEARRGTTDAAIHARLADLTLYTRYVELWLDYSTASGPPRQAAFEALIRHAYRMRTTMMIHAKALYRDLAARDKSVAIPKPAVWNIAEGKNPWKSSEAFARSELDDFIRDGIARRKLLDFAAVAFSDNLQPVTKLKLPDTPVGSMGIYSRGTRTYFTWVEQAPAVLKFTATGGLVYGNRGPAKLDLFPIAEPEGKVVAHAEVAPDKAERAVELRTTFTGLHRLEISDSAAGTQLVWPAGQPMTLQSSADAPAALHGRWSLWFYVPKGTPIIGGFAAGPGALVNPAGKKVREFDAKPGYFSVPVEMGQDGKLWQFANTAGQRQLLTVPPYLARSPQELLLPREVIEAEGRAGR